MKKGLKIAVVGATGAVGRELLSILESRKFPVEVLVPFASQRSEGKSIQWNGRSYPCQTLSPGCFTGVDIAFFDASDAISKEWVPQAAESGAWVVDNSAVFRLEKDILLLVPEVNGDLLQERIQKQRTGKLSWRERILSGPNCSTVQLVLALKPIRDRWGIQRVIVSTYQSTSGAGSEAMEELSSQILDVFNRKKVEPKAFTHQIAFNCIPHIGGFQSDGFTSEEHKIILESRKILNLPELRISATAVRVPTLSCHGESVNVELNESCDTSEIKSALKAQPGLILQDDPGSNIYPMGMTHPEDRVEGATGKDGVYVGRVREDFSVKNGIHFWVVSDNLRKGAALNAIQLGESLLPVFDL